MRALLVDDSRTHRMIIGQMLRAIGMEVLEAKNGLEALEQIKRNPDVELMLVDWNMPEMNGLDFIRAVRSQRAYDAVPILMVTSEAQGEQVTQALGANRAKEVEPIHLGHVPVQQHQLHIGVTLQ